MSTGATPTDGLVATLARVEAAEQVLRTEAARGRDQLAHARASLVPLGHTLATLEADAERAIDHVRSVTAHAHEALGRGQHGAVEALGGWVRGAGDATASVTRTATSVLHAADEGARHVTQAMTDVDHATQSVTTELNAWQHDVLDRLERVSQEVASVVERTDALVVEVENALDGAAGTAWADADRGLSERSAQTLESAGRGLLGAMGKLGERGRDGGSDTEHKGRDVLHTIEGVLSVLEHIKPVLDAVRMILG